MARRVGCSKLGLKPTQLYVRLSIILLSQQVNLISSGIIRHYVVAFVCLHFALLDTWVLNSLEDRLHYVSGSRKFLRQSAQPPWGSVYIYIYIYKVRLSLRKNTTWKATTKHYDWALLNNRDIRDKYALELRNRFEALQEKTEKDTPNDEYENFVEVHLEAASKCIPTKPRTKYRVPWETLAVREKCALVKTASKSYRKNPTSTNARKLEKAQYQLAGIYLKEQAEYIQNQIDKIRDSVEDRQSRIAWQTINEVSRRKSTAKAKLKAETQKERVKLWEQHFKNLLGN